MIIHHDPEEDPIREEALLVWTDVEHLRWYQEEMHELSVEIDRYLRGELNVNQLIDEHVHLRMISHQFDTILAKRLGADKYTQTYNNRYRAEVHRLKERVFKKRGR